MATDAMPKEVTDKSWLPSKGQVGFGIDFAVRIAPPKMRSEIFRRRRRVLLGRRGEHAVLGRSEERDRGGVVHADAAVRQGAPAQGFPRRRVSRRPGRARALRMAPFHERAGWDSDSSARAPSRISTRAPSRRRRRPRSSASRAAGAQARRRSRTSTASAFSSDDVNELLDAARARRGVHHHAVGAASRARARGDPRPQAPDDREAARRHRRRHRSHPRRSGRRRACASARYSRRASATARAALKARSTRAASAAWCSRAAT